MKILPPLKIDDYGTLLKSEILKKINEEINKPWETGCKQNGKKILLPLHWKKPVRDLNICEVYRKKGWYVFHIMDGPLVKFF